MNAYVIDIESNNLYPYSTITWTIVVKKVNSEESITINPFREEGVKQKIIDFIFREENPTIVTQNGLGFDMWILMKDFDMEFSLEPSTFCGRKVTIFDTLYMSQYLLPDREGGHSLRSWGERFGDFKIDYYNIAIELGVIPKGSPAGAEFSVWTPQMDIYCYKDCLITEQVFLQLYRELQEHNTMSAYRVGQKGFYLMNAQAFTGFKFDKPKAILLKAEIEEMIVSLKNEVEPDLPPRKLKKAEEGYYTFPASIRKKNGELSSRMIDFINKHEAHLLPNNQLLAYGKVYDIVSGEILDVGKPMNLEDQNALKDYFIEEGWKPTLWNVKKDSKGKAMRDAKKNLIYTSPKIQENGKICSNLLVLQGELPKKIVKFLSLRNRLGVLTGWLENKRLDWDGRISAGSSGIASTHRQKHVTVNL